MVNIENLTGEELQEINDLLKLKEEADTLYRTVLSLQKVCLRNDNKHIVWEDEHNCEYLTQTSEGWVWVVDYLHSKHSVTINPESIFSKMKSAYYFKKDKKNNGYVNHAEEDIRYFKAYVSKLKEKSQ